MNLNVIRNLLRGLRDRDDRLADALEQILRELEELDKRLKRLGG